MEQPPFPIVLVVLVAMFGFLTFTAETPWIKVISAIATLTVAAAALFQSRPRKSEGGPPPEEPPA